MPKTRIALATLVICALTALLPSSVASAGARGARPGAAAPGRTVNDFALMHRFVLGGVARGLPPDSLRIRTGDTVVWTNLDPMRHDVTFETIGASYDLPTQGSQARHTFHRPGSYPYRCVLHPGMDGLVSVSDSAPY